MTLFFDLTSGYLLENQSEQFEASDCFPIKSATLFINCSDWLQKQNNAKYHWLR